MRKGFLGGVGLAVIIVAGLICVAKCTVRVPAGYVAVEYKMNGGISNDTLPQGWHLISPTVKTSLYSIGIEQSYLTSEDKGDSPKDESFKTPTADGKQLLVPEHCMYGTKGWEIVDELDYKNLDSFMVCCKSTFGFDDWNWEEIFNTTDGSLLDIEIIGVCTDICVITNALLIKTYYPEAKITVDASCCAGSTPEKHKAALDVMESCQINVINRN